MLYNTYYNNVLVADKRTAVAMSARTRDNLTDLKREYRREGLWFGSIEKMIIYVFKEAGHDLTRERK